VSPPLRVLLAEPDALVRAGIRMVLEGAGLEVCAEPLDARAALELGIRTRPDACLIAERLPGGAIAAVEALHRDMPGTRLMILTEAEEPRDLFPAVRAGASGFVRKDLDPTRLAATVRGVVDGEAALSRRLTFRVLENLRTRERGRAAPTRPGGPSMTDRELEVLEAMAEGLRTSEIAARLTITDTTVRRHVSSAVSKLGVTDRAAAIAVLTGRSPA
jgi:DNA-binding NarL/FixJ family response regulator